jgi:3-hydroxymyristoyl/3-hydroxydecanoyl-(acyl carrier protein) dehydratase
MRFRRPVRPGDDLLLEVRLLAQKRKIWQFAGEALVGEVMVADGQFLATIQERP